MAIAKDVSTKGGAIYLKNCWFEACCI